MARTVALLGLCLQSLQVFDTTASPLNANLHCSLEDTTALMQRGLESQASVEGVDVDDPKLKKPPAQKIAELKQKVSDKMTQVATGMNKGASLVGSKVQHGVGNLMSKANAAVDDIHTAANNAMQGMKDVAETASEPMIKQVNGGTALFNTKVKTMITRINKAIDDMKGGVRDLAHGMTDGLKEASEKIAAQLAQSVHEHVRQEIDLARAAEPASLLELGEEGPHPAQKIAALKEKVNTRVNTVMHDMNKGFASVNGRVGHGVNKLMEKANTAVEDLHTAAGNAMQNAKDLADTASEPMIRQVNDRTAQFNTKVKGMITKINKAIEDMKTGVHDLAKGMTDGMKEASEKIAAQLAQSVHEHVRQEIELARAAEPASLLQAEASNKIAADITQTVHERVNRDLLLSMGIEPMSLLELEGPHPAEKIAALKQKVSTRMNQVATGMNKGMSTVNGKVSHGVSNLMSRANAAVDDIHAAASNSVQGMKDLADTASEPIMRQVNNRTALFNVKVKSMITRVNKGIEDMKSGVHDLARGMTDGLKEASEKIAAQLAQSVHEHVRQEIELARAAEPASLLQVKGPGHAQKIAHLKEEEIELARAA